MGHNDTFEQNAKRLLESRRVERRPAECFRNDGTIDETPGQSHIKDASIEMITFVAAGSS